jgi:hypothetical protein
MKKIIIFCQAPANVQYLIDLYENNRESQITVVVINVKGVFDFIESLNLELHKLIFVPYRQFSYSAPITITKERKRLHNLYIEYFFEVRNAHVYFFSIYYDWLTFFFIKELSRYNQVSYFESESRDDSGYTKKMSLKNILYRTALHYITGIKFNFTIPERNEIVFDYIKYNIIKESVDTNSELIQKYLCRQVVSRKSLLLLETDPSSYDIFVNYIENLTTVLELIRQYGYDLYVKPHPRLGYSKCVDPFLNELLPSNIPAEFIDISNFKIVIKIESTCRFYSDKTVYSIIDLFEFKNTAFKEGYYNTLKQTNPEIHFLRSVDDFKKILGQ